MDTVFQHLHGRGDTKKTRTTSRDIGFPVDNNQSKPNI